MIRRLLAAFTKQMDTGLDGASPRSVQISAGMARLVFASPVTSCESAGVSIATDTGFTSTPVTPAIGTDGSLLLFGGGITNGQVLKFTGTVTIAGASVPFDVIRATSLAEARLAVASVGMPITIISAKDVVISGTSIFFSDANTSIEFPSEVTQYPVSSPSVYLRSSGCNVGVRPNTFGGLVNVPVDAGLGRNVLLMLTEYYNAIFSIRGSQSLDSYNFRNFVEVSFPYGMVFNKPPYGTTLTFNLGTKNVIDTLTFGAKAGNSINPSGDMAIISGTAKSAVITGLHENATVNFNGGVGASPLAFTIRGAKSLNVNFATDNAVDMAFGKLTLSNTENLHITVTDNAVSNSISVNDLNVTNLSSLTLTDLDADDSASIVLNGTLASNSLLDFSGFAGDVTLTDNIGAAVIALATAHGNTVTLRAPAADGTTQVAASIVSYASATLGAGDTITLFDVTADKLRFDASLSSTIRFATDSVGLTSVFVGASDIAAVTLPATTGFSASNIIFTA